MFVLDRLWNPLELEASLKSWHGSHLEYTWLDMPIECHLTASQTRQAVTMLIKASAFSSSGAQLVVGAASSEAQLFTQLSACNLVEVQVVGATLSVHFSRQGMMT